MPADHTRFGYRKAEKKKTKQNKTEQNKTKPNKKNWFC